MWWVLAITAQPLQPPRHFQSHPRRCRPLAVCDRACATQRLRLCAIPVLAPLQQCLRFGILLPICVDQFASHFIRLNGRMLQQCVSNARHHLHGVLLLHEIFQHALALLPCAFSTCLAQEDEYHAVAIALLPHLKGRPSEIKRPCGSFTETNMVWSTHGHKHCVGATHGHRICDDFNCDSSLSRLVSAT